MIKDILKFEAKIEIIGINPFVFVPDEILQIIFKQAGKAKGHIPIKGTINNNPYKQTLVRYNGEWRLYINTTMLKNSPKLIGEIVTLSISFDPKNRTIEIPDDFVKALETNPEANFVFKQLSASRKQEIVRYLARLKTKETLDRNITKAINFLLGKEIFVGREKPNS
ncbi:MAG: YdeI/OmpD-associated family protein [Bacteroidota bacterium]